MNDNKLNSPSSNLEYVRRLYSNILDWYKNADLKANIILTIDGAFLTFISVSLFSQTRNLGQLPVYTLILLGLMAVTLALSLYHAIACIWSRILSQAALNKLLMQVGVDRLKYKTYDPSLCWFFQHISSLDKTEFEKRMRNMEPTFEIEAMASQIYILSGNVRKKHEHVNYGFIFAMVTFLLFLASAATFLLYQQGIL